MDFDTGFPRRFFKLFWAAWATSTSECWRLEKYSWLLVKDIFLSPLRFLILNDSILMGLFMGYKNFIFKHFTKERRNSSEFSKVFVLLSICFSCLIIVGKVANLLLTYLFLTWFLFMFVSYRFGPGWSIGWGNGERRSFLIVFLFLLHISEELCWLKNFSVWDTFCAVCPC